MLIYLTAVYLVLLPAVSAFGAGNIPSYGALEGLAFRHGDIEDILLQLSLVPMSSGASGFLSTLNPLSRAGKKFNSMAVKRVYFGNFLRDYSQAIDVGTLSRGIDAKTINLVVWIMSFIAFGYATEEFEVTEARLGVYRPEEHIDNPRGYPNPEEPDARKFDRRLRGPVQTIELEIDPESGMKNYIANERGNWMTSAAYIRNSLLRCIELGREYRRTGQKVAKYESLRILGQALHTLEDFPAHSNYIELVLIELGHHSVFPQVGLATKVKLCGREVYPLTTGTFGGLDFVHSLLGEAADKLSQTQITDLTDGLASSSAQGSSGLLDSLQKLTATIPGSSLSTRDFDDMVPISRQADQIRMQQDQSRAAIAIGSNPDEIARKIYPIMAFRDRMMKALSAFCEKIPGFSDFVTRVSEALTVWVLSTIEPFVRPVIEKIKSGLAAGQSLVTSKHDQTAVFDDALCSDPTHSMLAKDHFSCYLNQPAGLCGQAIVKHVAARITAAWADSSLNPLQLVDEVLEVLHHPANVAGRTPIQSEMRNIVEHWYNDLGVRNGMHHEGGSIGTTGVLTNHFHQAHGSDNLSNSSSAAIGSEFQPLGASRQSYNYHDTMSVDPSRGASWHATRPYDQAEQGLQRVADKLDTGVPGRTPLFNSSITAANIPQTENLQGFSEYIPQEDDRPHHSQPFGLRFEAQPNHKCEQGGYGSALMYSDIPYGKPNAEGEGRYGRDLPSNKWADSKYD